MGHFQSQLIQCLNNVARDPDVICLFVYATYNSAILPGLGLSTWADFPHGTKMAAAVPGGRQKECSCPVSFFKRGKPQVLQTRMASHAHGRRIT